MHGRLRDAAHRHGVQLDLRERMAEQTGLPDDSADTVISSLVLCSVQDPAAVLAEVRRILRPGGTFRFLEHVVAAARHADPRRPADPASPVGLDLRGLLVRTRPGAVSSAPPGSRASTIERYRIHTPFLPFNTHIAGIARA